MTEHISSSSNSELLAKRGRRSRRFTPLTRELCLQHHACGFGYKKISKATGIPISTIKYHVRKERGGAATSCDDCDGGSIDDDELEVTSAIGEVDLSADAALDTATTAAASAPLLPRPMGFERSVALVTMMHAAHDVLKKNVYAFARALQHDPHGAPGVMRAADPQLLLLALELLLQDPWVEHQELGTLAQILLQRLYSAQDFLRSAISLCHKTLSTSSSAMVAAASARAGLSAASSSPPAATKAAPSTTKYWDCPVCARRLIHTGKCAHQVRCLKKCKIVLTNEQLQAARAKAAAAVAALTESPEELKLQLKQALAPPKGDDKCHGQVRYLQLVVAVNAALQQDLETAPEAILESRELWRAVQSGPNPVVAALTLVSLALQYGGASSSLASGSDASALRKKALVLQLSQELAAQVNVSVDAAESFLARCAEAAATCNDTHDHEDHHGHHHQQYTCTCHRVRISALIS